MSCSNYKLAIYKIHALTVPVDFSNKETWPF